MARAATTTDVFNAVAEPRRREILDALADGEHSVTELVRLLGLAQPQVSKHLRVLRAVGAVSQVPDRGVCAAADTRLGFPLRALVGGHGHPDRA
jgi:DNA-binding transcriptional ArsR family regulator